MRCRAEHGFPARLVVPGFYGTNSVKWLTRMTLADSRAPGPFTTRWYNDPVLDEAGRETGETTPVWSIAPESVIVSPAPEDAIEVSVEREIWGWAWADGGVHRVDVRAGDGRLATGRRSSRPRTRVAALFDSLDAESSVATVVLASRAQTKDGLCQPISGRRNAIHGVPVNVI